MKTLKDVICRMALDKCIEAEYVDPVGFYEE